MIIANEQPGYICPVFNDLTIELESDSYSIGDLFFIDIYSFPSKDIKSNPVDNNTSGYSLVKSLVKNGNATGQCSFDISGVLATTLSYFVPPSNASFQKLETGYAGYFYTYGSVTFDESLNQVKTIAATGSTKWVFSGAFPLDDIIDYSDYSVDYSGYAKFLTNTPQGAVEIAKDANSYLSVLCPISSGIETKNLILKANHYFKGLPTQNGITISTNPITSGGLYLFNIRPDQVIVSASTLSQFVKADYWLEYQGEVNFSPNYQFDITTVRCVDSVPRATTAREAKKKDINTSSPTYNQYLSGGTYFFYDSNATACPLPIYGCTNPSALNYNPSANTDNGTCIFDTTLDITQEVTTDFEVILIINGDNENPWVIDPRPGSQTRTGQTQQDYEFFFYAPFGGGISMNYKLYIDDVLISCIPTTDGSATFNVDLDQIDNGQDIKLKASLGGC